LFRRRSVFYYVGPIGRHKILDQLLAGAKDRVGRDEKKIRPVAGNLSMTAKQKRGMATHLAKRRATNHSKISWASPKFDVPRQVPQGGCKTSQRRRPAELLPGRVSPGKGNDPPKAGGADDKDHRHQPPPCLSGNASIKSPKHFPETRTFDVGHRRAGMRLTLAGGPPSGHRRVQGLSAAIYSNLPANAPMTQVVQRPSRWQGILAGAFSYRPVGRGWVRPPIAAATHAGRRFGTSVAYLTALGPKFRGWMAVAGDDSGPDCIMVATAR